MDDAVKFVDDILKEALSCAASDIHFEPVLDGLKIRLRIDGLLHNYEILAAEFTNQVLARIKILARLDVAEKRIPQDGKFNLNFKFPVDFRVSTFPSLHGEKIVVRILEREENRHSLNDLGMDLKVLRNVKKIAKKSSGFFLVVGPTGSGKTTTLYSLLSSINTPEKNLVTLEDPIEYNIDNVTQAQIHSGIGFTFSRGIRAVLRQDPDVIMVGEIRDIETAQTAIQAALTGHLVLSTTHTYDSIGAVMRLLDMGIPAFLINATVSGILAQRLVRVLCLRCKYKDSLNQEEKEFLSAAKLSVSKVYRARGCDTCNNIGFKGRTGVFELLNFSQMLRERICSNPSYDDILQCALIDGFSSLQQHAIQKIEVGITTISELVRAVS